MALSFRGRPIFPPWREVFVFPAHGWTGGSLLWRIVVVVLLVFLAIRFVELTSAVWHCLIIGNGPGHCAP